MKSSLLIVIILLLALKGSAQSFTLPKDTVKAAISTSLSMYNNITNVSNKTISITWKVVDHDFPPDWQSTFAVCDNKLCYYNTDGNLMRPIGGGVSKTYVTDTFGPGTWANFYVLPDVTNGAPGTHYVKIDMTEGIYTKSSWYIVTKWPTGVSTIAQNDNQFVAFPNPATKDVTILHDKSSNVQELEIYNITGQKIRTYKATGSATKVDLSNFSNGIYFIKLLDHTGQVAGTIKLDHK
ncbi:MAG TPA: T9SS type A sorting domain-containing protein [Flavipsychrobacter sp.]